MQKNKDIFVQEFRTRPFGYLVQAIGILVIILNIYLSTKLSPLAKSLDEVVKEAQALNLRVTELEESGKQDAAMLTKIEVIETKISDIQTRLERIDTRLAKHMGI